MIVNICGIPYKVVECNDKFNSDFGLHLGTIDFKSAEIRVNKEVTEEIKKETICHEMVHGILAHIGRDDLSSDEQFVQTFANAIYQGFGIKDLEGYSVVRNVSGTILPGDETAIRKWTFTAVQSDDEDDGR